MQVRTQLLNLISDEQGGEVMEYALILGLIIVAAGARSTAAFNQTMVSARPW